MIINFFKDVSIQVIIHSVLGIVVYYLTKSMVFMSTQEDKRDNRSSSIWALFSVILTYFLISLIFGNASSSEDGTSVSFQRFDFNSIISVLLSYLFVLSPSLVIMRLRREKLHTVGVSKVNLGSSALVGIVISIVALILLIPFADKGINNYLGKVNVNLFWGLIYFAIVGFSEEFLFRGYLQLRLMAWIGNYKGWIISTIIMALIHIPQRIAMQGMTSMEALLSSIALIPVSLLLGYIMMRTKNIVAPGIVHTFANWYNIIFS